MDNREIMTIEQDLTSATTTMYCSIDASTRAGQMTIYNAVNAPTGRLASMIGKTLLVMDVIAEEVYVNQEDGTQSPAMRVILITDKGESYTCVSYGVYNAVKRLMGIFGPPTWAEPLPIEVKQVATKGKDGQPRNIMSLAVVK